MDFAKSKALHLAHFPSLDKVQHSIKKLSQGGFPTFQPNDDVGEFVRSVSKILTNEFNVLPNIPQPRKIGDFGFKFFRVRELEGITNKDLVPEYSYCPANLTKSLNRCNFPNYPVFYCSSQPMIALCEVVKNDDFQKKRYIISRWSLRRS